MKLTLKLVFFLILMGSFCHAANLPADFKLNGLDLVTQKPVDVRVSAAPKATIVVFVAASCPCSRGHEQSLSDLHKVFAAQGFQFIGVHANANESVALASAHFKDSKLPFPVVHDQGAKLADLLGALKTPHAFVISPGGEVLFSGGVDDSKSGVQPKRHYLEVALKAVAEGKRPDPSEVKTLGCVIERP